MIRIPVGFSHDILGRPRNFPNDETGDRYHVTLSAYPPTRTVCPIVISA